MHLHSIKRYFFQACFFLLLSYMAFFANKRMNYVATMYGPNMEKVWAEWHEKHINNKGKAPNQYRILTFQVAELFMFLGLQPLTAYKAMMVCCLFLSCFFLLWMWRHYLKEPELIPSFVIFFLLIVLCSDMNIQPAEPLNLLFFVICFALFMQQRWVYFFIMLVIASANKLTMVFFAPFMFFYFVFSRKEEPTSWTKLLSFLMLAFLLPLLTRFAVISAVGKKPYYTKFIMLFVNWELILKNPHLALAFLWLGLLPIILIYLTRERQPAIIKANACMCLCFLIGHACIAVLAEVRLFFVTFIFNVPGVMIAMRGLFEKQESQR